MCYIRILERVESSKKFLGEQQQHRRRRRTTTGRARKMRPMVVFRLSFRKRILFAFAFVAFIFGTSFGGGGVSAAEVDDDGGAKASSQCVSNVPKWRQTNLCQKNLVIFAHDTEFYGSLTVKKKFFMTLLNGEEIEVGRKIAEQDEEMDELVAEVERLTQELAAVKMTCLSVKAKQSEVYQPPSPPSNPSPRAR